MQEDFAAVQRIDSAPPPATSTAPVPAKAAAARTFAAPSKLEPFLLLAKSARGAGAASLIDQVTAAPGVFAFGELLETKAVAELEHSEQHSGKWLALQIFAYGNLADYRQCPGLPQLNKAQLTKLKQLTLVDITSKSRLIPYSTLLQQLDIPSEHRLEDFIIEAMYHELLQGRLNQKHKALEVDNVIGRDVRLQSLPTASSTGISSNARPIDGMLAQLQTWHSRVGRTLQEVDGHIQNLRNQETTRANYDKQQSSQISAMLVDIKKALQSQADREQQNMWGGVGATSIQYEDMPIDVDEGRARRSPQKGQNRKRTRA